MKWSTSRSPTSRDRSGRRAWSSARSAGRPSPAAPSVRGRRSAGVDSHIVDQIEMAGGTVAGHLGLPFVSVGGALPINLDVNVPPVNLPWPYGTGVRARLRNWVGNAACEWTFSGVVSTINRQRRAWGLPPVRNFNALFSGLAQVSQLPAALELPGRRPPPHFHHTGPCTDAPGRAPAAFPWARLHPDRPLGHSSRGALQAGGFRALRGTARSCR